MRRLSAIALLLLAPVLCHAHPEVEEIALIQQDALVEASGLARSQISDELLWALNDGGSKPRVYAFDESGRHRGRLTLDPARNRDWEAMASFRLDGKPYLLVGDIGDNDGRYGTLMLYIVEEPDVAADDKVRSPAAWTIEFHYPDGPADAEALAVDVEAELVYILTKRSIPAQLYSVPLREAPGLVTATHVGAVESLPRPRRMDVRLAPDTKDWFWQPVGMDFSADGRAAAIATYRNIYLYSRNDGEAWIDALNRAPRVISLGGHRDVESVVFGHDGASVFSTTERLFPPLLKAPAR